MRMDLVDRYRLAQEGKEMVEVPVEFLERLDQRAANIQSLVLLMKLLVDDVRCDERERCRRLLWPTN